MLHNFPELAFLPVGSLVMHERYDDQRTPPLVERMQLSQVFRNPPIVSPFQEGSGRYMVLDGANRITALKRLGYPHALVQIIQSEDPGLKLQTWNHVIWELSSREFLMGLESIPGIDLASGEQDEPDLWGDCGLGLIQIATGAVYTICTTEKDIIKRVALLNAVVSSYIERAYLDRTEEYDVESLKDIFPNLSGLVIFPRFSVQQVMSLASSGYLLPAGITRFSVSPRALHVNYPLAELASHKPLEEKNAALKMWIQERIERRGVRYYPESTVLFDE